MTNYCPSTWSICHQLYFHGNCVTRSNNMFLPAGVRDSFCFIISMVKCFSQITAFLDAKEGSCINLKLEKTMISSFLCPNSVNSRHQDGSKDDQKMKTHCKFLQILPESDLLPLLQCAFAKSALVAPTGCWLYSILILSFIKLFSFHNKTICSQEPQPLPLKDGGFSRSPTPPARRRGTSI